MIGGKENSDGWKIVVGSGKKARQFGTPISANSFGTGGTPKTEKVVRKIDFDKEVDLSAPVAATSSVQLELPISPVKEAADNWTVVNRRSSAKKKKESGAPLNSIAVSSNDSSVLMPPPPPLPPVAPPPPMPKAGIKRTENSKNLQNQFAGVLESIKQGGVQLKKRVKIDKVKSPSTPVHGNQFKKKLRKVDNTQPKRPLSPSKTLNNSIMEIIKLEDGLRELESRREIIERRNKKNEEFNNKLTDARRQYDTLLKSLAPVKLDELKKFTERFSNDQKLKDLIKEFEYKAALLKSILEKVDPKFYVKLEEYSEDAVNIQKAEVEKDILRKKFVCDQGIKSILNTDEEAAVNVEYLKRYRSCKKSYTTKVANRTKAVANLTATEMLFIQVKEHEADCQKLLSRAGEVIARLTKIDEEIRKNAGVSGDVSTAQLLAQQNEQIIKLQAESAAVRSDFRIFMGIALAFGSLDKFFSSSALYGGNGKLYLALGVSEVVMAGAAQLYEGYKTLDCYYNKRYQQMSESMMVSGLVTATSVYLLSGIKSEFVIAANAGVAIVGAMTRAYSQKKETAEIGI